MSFGQATAPVTPEPDAARLELVERAKETWTGQLVDLGGRNTLLYYKDLKVGTLDLGPGSGVNEVLVDELLASRTVALSDMFGDDERPDAAKRARTIRAKSTENFEERGLRTLFLAWGMATWSTQRSSAVPAAPVLLRQAHLAPKGRADESFDISLPGEWEVNPTLLHALREDFGVTVLADELLGVLDDGVAGAPNPNSLFDHFSKLAASVPEFMIEPRIVLGNFSYAKMTMVADLETGTDALVGSDLICAIAGFKPAQEALRDRHPAVAVNEPDLISPADEFLVLDADASQSYAVNAAVHGGDLVVKGPPGTGKSQTIANLIATLAARGQRILFVAEKRAAIDVVVARLTEIGLSDIVLDLHDGVASKRKLARDLARSLADASSIARPEVSSLHDTLVRRRADLVAHNEAMHGRRAPWDVSVYEILCRRADIPETAQSPQSVNVDVLTGPVYRQARQDLRDYSVLGGLGLSPATSPWFGALGAGTVATAALAEAASTAASNLCTHTWPQVLARLKHLAMECGLRQPTDLPGWGELLELVESVFLTCSVLNEAAFSLPLLELTKAMAPADKGLLSRSFATLTNRAYRTARKQLGTVVQPGTKPASRELFRTLSEAAAQKARWSELSNDGRQPRLAGQASSAKAAYGQVLDELRALGSYAALHDLVALSEEDLSGRLNLLASDTETLSKLPQLIRLRSALGRTGLGSLLDELSARNLTVDNPVAALDWVWLTSLLKRIQVSDARVGAFERSAHDRNVGEYCGADRAHISSGPREFVEPSPNALPRRVTGTRSSPSWLLNRRRLHGTTSLSETFFRSRPTCWGRSSLVGPCPL